MSEEEIRRPKPVQGARSVDQLGILVLDGSGSMGASDASGRGTKAEAVAEAVKGLVDKLQGSTRKQDFSLSLIVFDNEVETRLEPTSLSDINMETFNTNPYLGGATSIGDALGEAGKVAQGHLSKGGELPLNVVIMLMSDGENVSGQDPLAVAEKLKDELGENGKICCVAYGADSGQDTLRAICSEPVEKFFVETQDPEALRSFFVASMMAVD